MIQKRWLTNAHTVRDLLYGGAVEALSREAAGSDLEDVLSYLEGPVHSLLGGVYHLIDICLPVSRQVVNEESRKAKNASGIGAIDE